MKRYKVRKINDTILWELPFPDLLIKYSTGLALMLKVKEGEYLPIEILDVADLQRSSLVGSLGAYIRTGKVIVEDDEKVVEKPKPQIKTKEEIKKVVETKPLEHSVEEVKPEPSVEQPQQQKVEPSAPQNTPINDLSQVKTVEDFLKLSYFLRTKFVTNCTDKALLTSLLEKIDSVQLKVSIKTRLSLLK